MKNEQEIVRSVFDAYIRDVKATSTKKDRPTFDMLEKVKNRAIKALEQQPCDDVMAIHTQGLAEGIRCAMCTNSMKSDSGCDGGCIVDNAMYKKVMDTINNQMFSQPTSEDCVSRQAIDHLCFEYLRQNTDDNIAFYEHFCDLSPVTPTHGICKDCKHWKDSDGVYRRGVGAESKCPINIKEVYEGNFYCKWFEKRGSENEIN